MNKFPSDVHEYLGWYVYRLIDPRNGHTFYVGKGKGDRIFQHARGALNRDKGDIVDIMDDQKIATIKEIERSGLHVLYVVHRHGIKTPELAYEIEAALIDAYPGLTNLAGGYASAQNGCRTVEQIVATYKAETLTPGEPLILIFIGRALDEGKGVYDAVRAAWRMNRAKAEKYKLVLAYDYKGLIVGAFRPEKWLIATKKNFPFLPDGAQEDRIRFEGHPATDVEAAYLGKKVPPRPKGAMTPFRYLPH